MVEKRVERIEEALDKGFFKFKQVLVEKYIVLEDAENKIRQECFDSIRKISLRVIL